MSHFTTIETQIRDIAALKAACAELGVGLEAGAEARGYGRRQVRGDYDAAEIMDVIVHTFSHFRLHLQPLRLRKVAPRPGVGDNADLRWVGRAELACLGLPAPIRRLLHSL